MGKKRSRQEVVEATKENEEVPTVRYMEEEENEPEPKKTKWINKQRVLVLGFRGLSYRDRHLMNDIRGLMPHSKSESKMRRSDKLFSANEMAEMKNCNKCVVFEGRRQRDLYLWVSSVERGPSAKFQVENVHTSGELKMTGNCLKGSRPLLSFDPTFDAADTPHYSLLKELLTQTFGVPKCHPKSQPFFDRVYMFSIVDEKVWFRHFQIMPEEDGSLAEIGPRFVLNPIKIFAASFSGETLWENPRYVSPTANRIMLKKMKAGKYLRHVESKAAYEATRPTESTYKVDKTDDVFATIPDESGDEQEEEEGVVEQGEQKAKKPAKLNKVRRKRAKAEKERKEAEQEEVDEVNDDDVE